MRTTRHFLTAAVLAGGLAIAIGGSNGLAAALRTVTLMDQCDPDTFNAAFGDGTCAGNPGGVHLDKFLAELVHTQKAGAWHFAPAPLRLRSGEQFVAENHGGETHTFTEVDEFGGGFIDELNQLSGNPKPAPECLDFAHMEFVPPGGSTDAESESVGVHHYQCCIHPWMRTDVIVR